MADRNRLLPCHLIPPPHTWNPCAHLGLLHRVHQPHVLQVLHGTVQPVVEGRYPPGKLQLQLVDGL